MSDDAQAQSSSSLWANMLGLGPIMQTASDPQFLATLQNVLNAIAETRERCERMERRLERLDNLVVGLIAGSDPIDQHRTNGSGASSPASRTADDGSRESAPHADGSARNTQGLVE